MATLIGQELGGYRIISQVGKGGMATVYKAFQPSLDRYVAVKVMPPFYAQEDETFIKRFKREAQSIAKLRHPNILLVIDFGEHNGLIYIVMEFVDAGTLTERLGKPIPFDQAAKIIDQVASALDHAHMQGLVHRDVKPSNILLPKPDWPLLTDFGLAKIVGGSQLTITGTIAGTPAYMSPEQGQGESVDARSDIYSLGIVLYEMMTGCVPYLAETPMAVVVKHIIEPLPLPTLKNPDLPEAVERVILKALAKNPDDRYQRSTALAQAFRDAIGTPSTMPSKVPTVLGAQMEDPGVMTVVEEATQEEAVEDAGVVIEPQLSAEIPFGITEVDAPPGVVEPPTIAEESVQGSLTPSAGVISHPAQKSFKDMLRGKPWLKWIIPAGGAVGALCLIGLAIAFLVVPALQGRLGTETPASPTLTAEEHFIQGNDLFDASDFESAILEYRAAIDQGFEDYSIYFSLAESLYSVGRVEEALETVDRVVRLAPANAGVHEAAAWFYQGIGYHYQAITHFENALAFNPDARHFLEALAESYVAVGDYEKAEEIRGQTQQPGGETEPSIYEAQGWEFYEAMDLDRAEEAFQKAIDLDPGLIGAWEGLAEIYWYRGQHEMAIETLNNAVAMNEDYAPFHEKLGWLYWELGDLDLAEQEFNKALFLDSSLDGAWDGLTEVYWAWGDLDGALQVIETAIKNNPDHDALYEKAAYLYWDSGDLDQAIQKLEQAIGIAPKTTYAYHVLSDIWMEQGDNGQAMAVLERALEENPNRADIHESIGYLFLDWGQYEDAIVSFNQSVKLNPENGWIYLSLFYAYQSAGRMDEAIQALDNAERYSYNDPWLLEALGWEYVNLDDCGRARNLFQRVLEIDPANEGASEGIAACSS